MPPKGAKADKGPSKKTEQKKKEKIVEDKTFGLKNKKGAKQQKFIQHVQKQTMQGNIKASKLAELERQKGESKKDQKKKEADELNQLFRPVEQKISKGADPKSVLCAFFKQGQCQKGAKCKFSHDLNIGRKGEKRNMYEDTEAKETMEDWDEAKLQDVVDKKHGEKNKSLPPTSIICKHFLDAVENSKYGWFWECPGGPKCHYKHALPPGFVLKKDQKKEEKKDEISLEELIEKERAALNSQNLTRVTLESFLKWKQKKRQEKKKKAADAKKQKKSDFKQGKIFGISGREMFEFNPDMIQADEGEEGEDALAEFRRKDLDDEETEGAEYSGHIHEINLEALEGQEMEIDEKLPAQKDQRVPAANGVADDEEGKLEVAGAIAPETGGAAEAAAVNGEVCIDTPIDENLFDGDDIDFVEDELEELDLED